MWRILQVLTDSELYELFLSDTKVMRHVQKKPARHFFLSPPLCSGGCDANSTHMILVTQEITRLICNRLSSSASQTGFKLIIVDCSSQRTSKQ